MDVGHEVFFILESSDRENRYLVRSGTVLSVGQECVCLIAAGSSGCNEVLQFVGKEYLFEELDEATAVVEQFTADVMEAREKVADVKRVKTIRLRR